LRYARVRRSFRFRAREGGRAAEVIHEGVQESWVGARWRGRIITRDGTRRVTGDAALARRAFAGERSVFRARESAFAYGDGPLARLDPADLPAGRDAIARALTDGIRNDRWGPYPESRGTPTGEPEQLVREHTAYSAIILLVYARLTADQRAALLDVLANISEADDLGMVTDSAGRTGRGVALAFPSPSPALPANSYRIVFDPESAEILEWTMTPPGGPSTMTPEQHEVVLGTGWAQRIGRRP
jgi:hypothetical protein